MSEKLYEGLEARDPQALDEAGDYYTKHVMAMTAEGLHSKADIAAELGWRDMEADRLTALIEEHNQEEDDACVIRQSERNSACDAYTKRGRECPDCPRHHMIDLERKPT